MKHLLLSASLLSINAPLFADPMISSWLTANSRKYARLYTSDAGRLSGISDTIFTRPGQSIVGTFPGMAGNGPVYNVTPFTLN